MSNDTPRKIVRYIFILALLYPVYRETGVVTSATIGLLFALHELQMSIHYELAGVIVEFTRFIKAVAVKLWPEEVDDEN